MRLKLITLVLFLIFLNIGITRTGYCGWYYEELHQTVDLGYETLYPDASWSYDFSNFYRIDRVILRIDIGTTADPCNRYYEIYINGELLAKGIAFGATSITTITKDITDIVKSTPKGTIYIKIINPRFSWGAHVYLKYDGVYRHWYPDENDQYPVPTPDNTQNQNQQNNQQTSPQQSTQTVEISKAEIIATGIGILAIIIIILKLIAL